MKDKQFTILIWILSTFIGLFLTLIFLIYNNYFIKIKNEKITDSDNTKPTKKYLKDTYTKKKKEKSSEYFTNDIQLEDSSNCPTGTETILSKKISTYTLNDRIPLKDNILITINNYNFDNDNDKKNINIICNTMCKWFDYIKFDNPDFDSQKNTGLFFTLSSPVKYMDFYGKLSNINIPQLTGPYQNNFSSTPDKPLIESFTLIFYMIINNISDKNNILFEMPINNGAVITNISVRLEKTSSCRINIIIKCGVGNEFSWTNIDKDTIENKKIMMSLSYDKDNTINNLIFTINKKYHKYDIDLSSYSYQQSPFIINKDNKIDMGLYSFTYYNTSIDNETELEIINDYNNYYINKLNIIDKDRIKYKDNYDKCILENNSIKETLQYTLLQKIKEVDEYKDKYKDLLNHPHSHIHSTY